MNVRTNTMRVYNDCLVDNIAQATGGDLARISTGGDPNCPLCGPWEGVIVSISGKTKGLPTYEQAREAGCFHPNCVHTLEYVDEIADEEEIELQKAHPVNTEEQAADPDAADERKYAIDQDRYRKEGMGAEEARVSVDRDNLAASIRHGLIRDDAREIVDRMTDAQVTALCPNGNPPTFEPTKGTKKNPEPERWNHGSRGGVVHIARNSPLEHILEVTKANEPPKIANAPRGGKSTSDGTMGRITVKELLSEAEKVENGERTDFKPSIVATIDEMTAKEVEAVTGITPKCRDVTITENEIVHTFNRHGKPRKVGGKIRGEKQKNQVPITAEDIALIPEIVKSADSISAGSVEKSRKLTTVKFLKKFQDGNTYTVFVLSDTMEYKTMWKKK